MARRFVDEMAVGYNLRLGGACVSQRGARASFPPTHFLAPAFTLEGAGFHSMNLPAFTPRRRSPSPLKAPGFTLEGVGFHP